MNNRERLPQEVFIKKLRHLMPDAKVSVRPYNNNERDVTNPVVLGDFLVDWHPENGELPTLETINSVDMAAVEVAEEVERVNAILVNLRNDYSMQAAFLAYKQTFPLATFDEFARLAVDEVENVSRR